jgi:hypothetical protein
MSHILGNLIVHAQYDLMLFSTVLFSERAGSWSNVLLLLCVAPLRHPYVYSVTLVV